MPKFEQKSEDAYLSRIVLIFEEEEKFYFTRWERIGNNTFPEA